MDKYTFPPAGTSGRLATPSHQLNKTFKFRDYAPKVFKKLRAHFGIEEVKRGGLRYDILNPKVKSFKILSGMSGRWDACD